MPELIIVVESELNSDGGKVSYRASGVLVRSWRCRRAANGHEIKLGSLLLLEVLLRGQLRLDVLRPLIHVTF